MTAGEQPSSAGFDLELALGGPDPGDALTGLVSLLIVETGASRVERLRVGTPPAGKRDAAALTAITLAVSGVANLVSVVDTVHKWLGARRAHAARQPGVRPEEQQIPSVTITLGDRTLQLSYPPDWVQSQAIESFLAEHARSEGQDGP